MSSTQPTRTVELPDELVSRIEERLPRTEWDDVGSYITYVMEELLTHFDQKGEEEPYEDIDEKEIRTRLRSLGYLNE